VCCCVSRLAPSPTGALHLGNARTFALNWAIARNRGWMLIMRMEDLDGPRIKAEAARQALDDLAWLGIDHDGPVIYQSADPQPYRAAMHRLAGQGMVYPCALTRKQIEQAATAPHRDDHELRYPPELRPDEGGQPPVMDFVDEKTNYRLVVPDEAISFEDRFAGPQTFHPFNAVGDFVVWTKAGQPSYQLAVVVDDHRQGVTDVVRGDDLLPSAARQQLIYRALGWTPPRWWHLPLVLGPDGRRLAKRHGDTRIAHYRGLGVPAQRIIGLLAWWCGAVEQPEEMSAEQFRRMVSLDALPREPVTFTEDAERWLGNE